MHTSVTLVNTTCSSVPFWFLSAEGFTDVAAEDIAIGNRSR